MPTTPSGSYRYSQLDLVEYGPNSLSKLPEIVKNLGAKKALVITGNSIAKKTDVLKQVEDALGDKLGDTFVGIGEHAPISDIKAAIEKLDKAGADILVSVGGGSPVDASKAIAYYYREQKNADKYLPHIAIPTTLSAAEYTINAGYKDENGNKVSASAPELAPKAIILDATLTLSTPERLWLSTGIRALDHAVESLYRPHLPYPILHLAYAAIRDLFHWLPVAKANPTDLNARQHLLLAAWISLFPNPQPGALGLSHALGHKLGAKYNIPHGITSCLTLAPVVALYTNKGPPTDKTHLASAVQHLHLSGLPALRVAPPADLAGHITGLIKMLGLDTTLKEWKVPKEDLKDIAEQASAVLGGREDVGFGARDVEKLLGGIWDGSPLLESVHNL